MPQLGSDYNMELVIALEMSRLQMIEDKIKQGVSVIETPAPGTSIANDSTSDDSSCKFITLFLSPITTSTKNSII